MGSGTKVVNIHHGSKFDVYIGRAGQGQDGYYGNPYVLGVDGDRDKVIDLYRVYFKKRIAEDEEFRRRVRELSGKRLGCFCRPLACHGDVILDWLEPKLF